MTLADPRRHRVHRFALGDVADVVLAVDLAREGTQPLLASREQHAPPPGARQRTRDRRADPARCARDDCYLHTRTIRRAEIVRPSESRATAVSVCRPLRTFASRQSML